MTTMENYLNEEVSAQEMSSLVDSLNKFFARYGITVKFMRHFQDRINDPRNKTPITRKVMIDLFNRLIQGANLKKLASMKNGQEGIMRFRNTNFVYTLEKPRNSKNFQLRFITAMDKDRFRSNSPDDFYLKLESFSEFYKRLRNDRP